MESCVPLDVQLAGVLEMGSGTNGILVQRISCASHLRKKDSWMLHSDQMLTACLNWAF